MQRILLARRLPDAESVHALNKQLLSGEIQLDWSGLQNYPQLEEDLYILLNNLDLDRHAEGLDLANGRPSIPDWLEPLILKVLENPRISEEDLSIVRPLPVEEVPVWEPESQLVEVPAGPILTLPSSARIRDELEELVLKDLLGPAGGEEEEVEESHVNERYLVGLLAPDRKQLAPEDQDELGVTDATTEDGAGESDTLQRNSFSPSSMGLSFCVDLEASALLVTPRWGQYKRVASETLVTSKINNPKLVWKRTPRGGEAHLLRLKEGESSWRPEPEDEEQSQVFVKASIRRTRENWLVTLFLVNGQHEPKRLRDGAWLFQPELVIESPDAQPIFQKRLSQRENRIHYEEQKMTAMLYRKHVSFAIGHNVSVHAETLPDQPTCAIRLSTRVVPSYEVPKTEAPTPHEISALAELLLDMRDLSRLTGAELVERLSPLIQAYLGWIGQQEKRLQEADPDLRTYESQAREALAQCRLTAERIGAGIQILAEREDAASAFAFMNQAMWQQRVRTIYAENRRSGKECNIEDFDRPENRSWRPFQLAFILLNLPALTNLHHQDRSTASEAIADLLWFPTGGGKTEAYLGLTAYTLCIRRLQGTVEGHVGSEGVAVLMRYTLRLLTLQQFQRAAALICACEQIRQADPKRLGTTPFRLGLWVGMSTTPNRTEAADEKIKEEMGQSKNFLGTTGTPAQLTHCPWCGHSIDIKNYNIKVDRERSRTLIYCGSTGDACPFNYRQAQVEGLPVLVVDEEIYRLLPALLIATVDKFAQLPWKGETQMLFGKVDQKCSRHGFRAGDLVDRDSHRAIKMLPAARSTPHLPLRPPDLIIQDELHLISGPLGTLVGLYENAIDHLSTWEVGWRSVRPKVIAATATIRRAEQQIQSLFLRQTQIFPPQGVDIEDNFFSRQRLVTEESSGRRYLGICANGRRLKSATIRVYVAYLAAGQALYEKYGSAVDPWMTLVGYFNSMRDLGGARRLVEDNISTHLRYVEQRGFKKRRKPKIEELTSRKSATDIPRILSNLEIAFTGQEEARPKESIRPIDVLLATNMISVGVDVKRLGLMVVNGQPKTTAEYIQATSRVGRTYPGLVCVVFNWSRPRDLSHYELFEHYHATFYQQVEALSVTPFASRALDRGLAGLLVSYIRLSQNSSSPNAAAGSVLGDPELFEQAVAYYTRRAEEISGTAEAGEKVRRDLERLIGEWRKTAGRVLQLGYDDRRDGKTIGLLQEPERGGAWQDFTCLNSLREVEPSVNLVLNDFGMSDQPYEPEGTEEKAAHE